MNAFVSQYVREQKRYTKNEIKSLFDFSESEVEAFIRRLKAYGVVKTVRSSPQQLDLSELTDGDVQITDETAESGDCFYVFTYVGVLTLGSRIIKCYPKYLTASTDPDPEMKQILKVLQRYSAKEQIINLYNGDGQSSSFNLLAVMLFLTEDYLHNGPYTNSEDIIEVNGEGPILWEQTINNSFTIISNNRPYYVDLYTHRSVDDEQDFFHRLHKSVVTECSRQLRDSGLLYLFDLVENEVSDEAVEDFGDVEYVLYRLQSEMSVQYNTHKQTVLKTLYAYLANRRTLSENQGMSMYGTTTFHTVWEKVCAEVFSNKLNHQLRHLPLPNGVAPGYDPTNRLIDIICKPKWTGYRADGTTFTKEAEETLVPDIITIAQDNNGYSFIILDAKYYCIRLEPDKPVRNQPGVGDVTKQYLYQLAYKEFIRDHSLGMVRNCFLMPTQDDGIIALGLASMDILDAVGLQQIQIRLLPASRVYDLYLTHRTMKVDELRLNA